MSQDPYLLGRLAVHYKLVTQDQVADLLRAQSKSEFQTSLGDLMVESGLVQPAQLEKLLAVQKQMIEKQAVAHQAVTVGSATGIFSLPAAAGRPAITKRAERAVDRLLDYAVRQGASDLRLASGCKLLLRIDGRLTPMGERPFGRDQMDQFVGELLDAGQREALARGGQVDFSTALVDVARFRGNAYRHQDGVAVALRAVPYEVPTLADLGLPSSLARLTSFHQGLVLITGPAGCGKTSTLAALLGIINEERRDHIVTIEDPIEYIHVPRRCSVNQRQVGRDTASFGRALKAALREDPDVIALGELRDLETISLALTAAETGHLVLGTLHTGSAIRTIDRVVGAYPPEQQPQIRAMFSESLRAVVSQRLVNRADGNGRVPAYEVLLGTRAVANLIREQKTFQLRSVLQTGAAQGMQLLDASLAQLLRDGVVRREEALVHAEDPKALPAA
jgi:twitching motility protein PilT